MELWELFRAISENVNRYKSFGRKFDKIDKSLRYIATAQKFHS